MARFRRFGEFIVAFAADFPLRAEIPRLKRPVLRCAAATRSPSLPFPKSLSRSKICWVETFGLPIAHARTWIPANGWSIGSLKPHELFIMN